MARADPNATCDDPVQLIQFMADSPTNGDEVWPLKKVSSFSRRQFFREAVRYSADKAVEIVTDKAGIVRESYLRPPGALPESVFLTVCTCCEACVAACPHNAISLFHPHPENGIASGTPVITPARQPCMMCDGFPCITACVPKALIIKENQKKPVLGIAKMSPERCWSALGQECSYCQDECRRHLQAVSVTRGFPPEIDPNLCDGCGRCEYICPVPVKAAIFVLPGKKH